MHANLSFGEGILRIFFAILWAGVWGSGAIHPSLAIVGVFAIVPLVTGMAGYCPLYHITGKGTAATPHPQDS